MSFSRRTLVPAFGGVVVGVVALACSLETEGQGPAPEAGGVVPEPTPTAPEAPSTPPSSSSAPPPSSPPAPPKPPPGPSASTPAPGVPAGPLGELFALVNAARAEARSCGPQAFAAAPALRWDNRLGEAAGAHSDDMAARDYLEHVSPEGEGPEDRARARGYVFSILAENIAGGAETPARAMASWLASVPHCAIIMNSQVRDFGAGRAEGGSLGFYWTEVFGAEP